MTVRIRRTSEDLPRIELTPLLDVVFLLLTFFIFSLVLMVRADVLGITLPSFGAATAAGGSEVITVTLDEGGFVWIDGDRVELEACGATVVEKQRARPDAKVLLAVDVGGSAGSVLGLIDQLTRSGVTDFSLIGKPAESAEAG